MAAWRDPATWGPEGRGCLWCTEGEPVSHGLCRLCWVRCLGWQWHIVVKWIGRQDAAYERQEERKDAMRRWHEPLVGPPDPSGIVAYAERYGVWLVSPDWIHEVMKRYEMP